MSTDLPVWKVHIHNRNEKNETFELLRRTLNCGYIRCNLDISYNSIINLRYDVIATFIILNSQLSLTQAYLNNLNLFITFQEIFTSLRKHNFLVVITKRNFRTGHGLKVV